MVHDSGQRIGNVQNEAGRELPVWFAGVNQARRVRNELARQHHLFHGREKLVTLVAGFGFGNVPDYPADNRFPVFERLSLRILKRVTLANYFSGIDSELLRLSTRGNGGGADAFVSNSFADRCAHYLCLSEKSYPRRITTQGL